MATPVARVDNSLFRGQAVQATPGRHYDSATEAEAAAKLLATGNQDAVIRNDGTGFRVDLIDKVASIPQSSYRSNELYGADRNVAAFVTGNGNTVSIRGTRDGSTAVDRVASVLQRAGLSADDARSMAVGGVSREQAMTAYQTILDKDGSLRDFGPRAMALRMLDSAAARSSGMSALELANESQRYESLAVVRPDGYLARMTSGDAIFRMGEPHIRDGVLMAGDRRAGDIIEDRQGMLREVDANLKPTRLVGEEPLGGAGIGEVLDGVQDAVGATVLGVANLVAHPIRSVEALKDLPANIRATIENSPELLDKFLAASGPDQIRMVSRGLTQAALTVGAVGAVRAVGASGARLLGDLPVPPLPMPMPAPAFATVGGRTLAAAAPASIPAAALTTPTSAAAAAVYMTTQANDGLASTAGTSGAAPKFNVKSRPQFGHTFDTHGQGQKITQNLLGRARGPRGGQQGQWLNNEAAGRFLVGIDLSKLKVGESMTVPIPKGLGQVIMPDGQILEATHAVVSPSATGIRTAYPIVPR